MRRQIAALATAVLVATALAIPAGATDLHPDHLGTGCEHGGVFHFVENGTGGVKSKLTVEFSNGDTYGPASPDKWNRGTNHWWVEGSPGATVDDAYTNKDANKLVISDVECRDGKKKDT